MFISFEGIGGAGKTTQAALLVDWLRQQGREVVSTREPGGTALGEALRDLLLNAELPIAPMARAALFAAARAQDVVEVVGPALRSGAIVVADRFVDSSLVYQGAVEEIGQAQVLELNRIVTDGLFPSLTFVLLIDEATASARRRKSDRIEPTSHEDRVRLDSAYRSLSATFPDRVVELDAALPVERVAASVRSAVESRLE